MSAFGAGFDAAVHVIGWTLVHFLWQGAATGVIYALLRPWFGSGRPRYWLGLAMLAIVAVLPMATAIVLSRGVAASSTIVDLGRLAVSGAADAGAIDFQAEQLLPFLVALWAAGVMLLTSRALVHWHALRRLLRRATPLPDWQDSLASLCRSFGVCRRVRLLWSARVATPTLIGWLKPVILLPAGVALGFPAPQLELILAHELGHIRRWDYIVNLIQVALETALFYHPVVHWVSRDLRHEREICCDELVLRVTQGSPRIYARALAELEHMRADTPLALAASGGVLLERVQRIAGVPSTALAARPSARLLPLMMVSLVVAAGLARQRPLADVRAVAEIADPWQVGDLIAPSAAPLQAAAEFMPTPTRAAPTVTAGPVAAPLPALPLPRLVRIPLAASPRELAAVGDITPAAPTPPEVEVTTVPAPIASPIALKIVQPIYPESALERGEQGVVVIEYMLDSDGGVRDSRVVEADPPRVFDAAAMQALRGWRYDPATVRLGVHYRQTFVFSLGGPLPKLGDSASEQIEAGFECRMVTGSRICRRPDGAVGNPRSALHVDATSVR